MNKHKMSFCCQNCGATFPKWSGQCTACAKWNTIIEEITTSGLRYQGYTGTKCNAIKMTEVEIEQETRISSGLQELDRVLGGGIMIGSAILLGGDPGIGKSTLLLQTLTYLSRSMKVLYITGEESPQQITLRARRLGLSEQEVWLYADTNIENILTYIHQALPNVVVIDSIQTMQTALLNSAPGSVGQVRESAMQLVSFTKQQGIILFLVGHVTKEGHLAGPRVLEHMVDTVLYFEGQPDHRYRLIRAVKNRYGAANELGIFAMTETGLREVLHPSAIFLSRNNKAAPGSIILPTREGSRPLLVEVQALIDQSHAGNPRRLSVGLDVQRISMLLAILNRHSGIATHNLDVFLNVVGGLEISETAADLPIILAILSSLKNRPIPLDTIAFGELGLSGEIRPVAVGQERLKEAAKHGFNKAIIPQGNCPKNSSTKIKIHAIQTIQEALNCFDQF